MVLVIIKAPIVQSLSGSNPAAVKGPRTRGDAWGSQRRAWEVCLGFRLPWV